MQHPFVGIEETSLEDDTDDVQPTVFAALRGRVRRNQGFRFQTVCFICGKQNSEHFDTFDEDRKKDFEADLDIMTMV